MYVAETEKTVDRFYAEGHGCDVPPIGLPARALGVSETYLASVVRFSTGRTFREFAQLRQLRVAKMLLVDTDRPVADIARSLGFPSAECFEKFSASLQALQLPISAASAADPKKHTVPATLTLPGRLYL